MKYLIPKTNKNKLQIFKWFTMEDICLIFIFLAMGVGEILLFKEKWELIFFPVLTSLIAIFLLIPIEKENKKLKNWKWLILWIKFIFSKQSFNFNQENNNE